MTAEENNTKSFDEVYDLMKIHGMKVPIERTIFRVPNAKEVLINAMKYFLSFENKDFVWLDEYEKVIEWLACNKGRGLLLYGQCGRGKSLLTRYVIPAILIKYCGKVVNVYDTADLLKKQNEILEKHIVAFDDAGTEETIVDYGSKKDVFPELIDMAEKQSKIVIISTNFDGEELRNIYGERIYDRIKKITKRILFVGDSLRE